MSLSRRFTIEDILAKLEAAKSTESKHHFIPDSKFNEFIKESTSGPREYDKVKKMIEYTYKTNNFDETREQIENKIIPHGLKIYMAIMLANEEGLLSNFLAHDRMKDSLLPFRDQDLQNILSEVPWERQRILQGKLMLFSAPILKEGDFSRYIDTQPLPFLRESPMLHYGRNSETSIVVVPFEHLDVSQNDTILPIGQCENGEFPPYYTQLSRLQLICKTLEYSSEAKEELRALRELPRHPSVIPLFHSFAIYKSDPKQASTLNLLFPRYDETLLQFLRRDNLDSWSVGDFVRAFSQLADGLAKFNSVKSRDPDSTVPDIRTHNDIKSGNIVVDELGYKIVLIDFGSATIRSPLDSDNDDGHVKNSYTAPEVLDITKASYGPKRDIWAVGCLLTEVVVYLHKPSVHTIPVFTASRKNTRDWISHTFFHSIDPQTSLPQLHPAVDRVLQNITDTSSNQELQKIVPVIRKILQVNPTKRPDAETVVADLCKILERASECDVTPTGKRSSIDEVIKRPVISLPIESSGSLLDKNEQESDQVRDSSTTSESPNDPLTAGKSPPMFLDMMRKQSQTLSRFLNAGNGLESRSSQISGRVKALWKRSRNGYCINKWASELSPSVIVIYNEVGDHAQQFAEIASIVAARIVDDFNRQAPEYHVFYHFFENANENSYDRVLQLATSILFRLSLLHEIADQRPGLIKLLESKDVSAIMRGFIKTYKKLAVEQRVIIVLDRPIGFSKNMIPTFEKMAEVIYPLVQLVHQTDGDKENPTGPPLKLFLSLPRTTLVYRSHNFVEQKWGVRSDETVINKRDPVNDDDQGLRKVFWENNRLPWFTGNQ